MVIRGAEPVIVDTNAPLYRDRWREQVFSIVAPEDVRWIFLSHDDGDHTGGLLDALELCPQATLVTNFFMVERLALEKPPLPLERMRWIDPGGRLRRRRPHAAPVQAATLRRPHHPGLYEQSDRRHVDRRLVPLSHARPPQRRTGAVSRPRGGEHEGHEQPGITVAPLARPQGYGRHVDAVEALGVAAVASAHGPIITGGGHPRGIRHGPAACRQADHSGPRPELLDTRHRQGSRGRAGLTALRPRAGPARGRRLPASP
jgi:hypothetical protein